MILPTKHLRPDRALLGVGADVLRHLEEPKTVSRVWDEVRQARASVAGASPITYEWFVLALDLLFVIDAVHLERGRLQRARA